MPKIVWHVPKKGSKGYDEILIDGGRNPNDNAWLDQLDSEKFDVQESWFQVVHSREEALKKFAPQVEA